jgi:hypothetical protein
VRSAGAPESEPQGGSGVTADPARGRQTSVTEDGNGVATPTVVAASELTSEATSDIEAGRRVEDGEGGGDGLGGSQTEVVERGWAADDPWCRRLARVGLAAVLATLAVAAVRAVRDGWVPVGDSALIVVRAHDVLGGGPQPRLGLWASTSWSVGFDLNHPGPLLYHLLAVPVALIGGGAGVVVGTVAIEGAAVTGTYIAAQRRGGPPVAAAAMACAGILCWAMGSAVLVEPWHATTVLLPFLCFVTLAWSVAAGDLVCLPWMALTGSLVLQTNLSYAVLVPVVAAGSVVALAVDRGRRRHRHPRRPWRERRRDVAAIVATAAVVLVAWALPLSEQVTGEGEGNVSRLVRSVGEDIETLDVSTSVRTVADVLALPPGFAPPSFADAFRLTAFGNPLPSLAASVAAMVVLVAALAAVLVDASRRRDRAAASAGAVAATLVVLALVTAGQSPTGNYGTVAYQLRWLWPVGAFVALAVAVAATRRFGTMGRAVRGWTAALAGLATAAAVLALPATTHGTTAAPTTMPVAQRLVDEVADQDLTGPLVVACGEHVFDPYCEAVMAELRDEDVPFLVPDGIGPRQLGEARRWDGRTGTAVLRVVTGDFAVLPPGDGGRTIALRRGLSQSEQLELFYLQQNLTAAVAAGDIHLNERGRRVAARGDLLSVDPDPGPDTEPTIDPARVIEVRGALFGEQRRDLVAMVLENLLEPNREWDRELARYAELQQAWDEHTVAVMLGPLPADPGAVGPS